MFIKNQCGKKQVELLVKSIRVVVVAHSVFKPVVHFGVGLR